MKILQQKIIIDFCFEFIENNIEKILVEYHNIDMENGAEFISQILSPEYEISVQNAHKGGGILLASKK